MELADLGRLRCRSRRAVLLRVLRAVSNDAGFSMGESFALWNWGCVVDSRSCSARSAGRRFIAERFSARSSQRLLCLLSRFSATQSSTSCDRCRPQLARRALGKRRLTLYYWIKMENLSASAICFPTRRGVALIFYRGFW